MERVRGGYSEDGDAVLEPSSSEAVFVQHREGNVAFHRRWARWHQGVVGFAATLRSGHLHEAYSVADMILDMVRLLRLVESLSPKGDSVIVIHVDPYRLAPTWSLSGSRAGLAGVEEAGQASTMHRTASRWLLDTPLEGIGDRAAEVIGHLVVQVMRKSHRSRVDSKKMIESIPWLLETFKESYGQAVPSRAHD